MTEIGSIYNDDGKRVARYVPKGPKMSAKAWKYTSTHGKSCEKCYEAVGNAESMAVVRGSVSSTYTLSELNEEHAGTATRSK
jgi:hypothetical protein